VPLDNNNVVLRGCSLKITEWVTGVVVYTGVDTKIMLNSNKTRQKKSRLEFKMGIIVALIFLAQMLITFLSAFLSVMSTQNIDLTLSVYINSLHRLMIKWGSWILLFTNFVPISLIVSLEMVKYIQGINISNSTFNTEKPAEVIVQTSSLNEELGQIQHIFSDKTGTLTKNHMNFKYMTIGTNTYGYDAHRCHVPANITNVDFHD
jgi:phospholipid-transporting ATPase